MTNQEKSASGNPVIEAAGTTVGLYLARWIEPRIKSGLSNTLEDLRLTNRSVHDMLLHGWKTDTGYRDKVDLNTILGITVINSLAGKITDHLGPFSEVVDEIVERVVSAVPDILPEVLTPAADKFQPEPGVLAPSRPQLEAAMRIYLLVFWQKLPRTLVGQIDAFNPSRWFTKMGEQMQQAVDACGPLAMLELSLFWMRRLDEAERDKYSSVYFAFNTPDEVMNFIGLPNVESRRLWLEMLFELHKMRWGLTLHEQRELFERLRGLQREQIGPFLRVMTQYLRDKRQGWRDSHPELFRSGGSSWLDRLPAWANYAALAVIVLLVVSIGNGCFGQ